MSEHEATTGFDLIGSIIAFEAGEQEWDDTVQLFQHLVDTGQAWTLQGSYGRTAVALIDAGFVKPADRS